MAENFWLRGRVPFVAILLVTILSVFFFRSSLDKALIAILLGLGYFIGLISLVFGVVFSVLGYVVSLPVISTIHSYIAVILAKIHYIVFRVFAGKVLRKMGWYNAMELRLKNNALVRGAADVVHNFFWNLGLERPRKVKFFEVVGCKNCKSNVPADGVFCPYCGEKLEIDTKSRRAVFQSQFTDFYSQIRDLAGLEGLKRHSFIVSWLSYKISLRLGLDRRLVARAGLLHDSEYEAIDRELEDDRKIEETVFRCTFPFERPPTSMESLALWTADKVAFVIEFLKIKSIFRCEEVWRKIKEVQISP